MGTRGKIHIYEDTGDTSLLCSLWSRFDSYPSVLGAEVIAPFCASKPLLSMSSMIEKCFLGMNDFALQFCSLLVCYRRPKIGGEMGQLPNMMKEKRWTSPATSTYFMIPPGENPYAPYEYHIYPDVENQTFLIEIQCNYEDEDNVNGIYSPEEIISKFGSTSDS